MVSIAGYGAQFCLLVLSPDQCLAFSHWRLGLGDLRTWKVVALATNYPTWSWTVFASIVVITAVSYLAHRISPVGGEAVSPSPPSDQRTSECACCCGDCHLCSSSACSSSRFKRVLNACSSFGTALPARSYTPQELQTAYHSRRRSRRHYRQRPDSRHRNVLLHAIPSGGLDRFSQEYHLPMAHIDVLAPLRIEGS